MALVVLEYSYKGVIAEGGSGDETLVCCVRNRADEVIYGLVDFFRREIGGQRAGEGIELVELESALFLVAPLSEELAGTRNLGDVTRYEVNPY